MYQATRTAVRTVLALVIVYGIAPAMAAQSNGGQTGSEMIASLLQAEGNYEQTTEALERAGLMETLAGQGPFTVFAPTDDAWQQLDESERESLMSEEGVSELRNVLSYHVVPDEIRAQDVGQMGSITTIQGQPLEISRDGESLTVNGAAVVEPGLAAENGIVHGIEQVLMPR